MPSCQALAPAAVAALAWASLRLKAALGGSCWARIQLLMPLTRAVLLIAIPHMPMTPAVATRTKPTIMALELAVLGCMSVMDDPVLVILSPDVVVLSGLAFPPVTAASHPRRVMSRRPRAVMITEHKRSDSTGSSQAGRGGADLWLPRTLQPGPVRHNSSSCVLR